MLVQATAEHRGLQTELGAWAWRPASRRADQGQQLEVVVPDGPYIGAAAVSPEVAERVLQQERQGRGRKIIAMTLYGDHPRYTDGAVQNAGLVLRSWRGWTLRIYHDDSVPSQTISRLEALPGHLELVRVRGNNDHAGRFWRFFALEDHTATRVIVRDIDARLTERDRRAVEEWEASGRYFHVLHDHEQHVSPVMAGLWGAVVGFVNLRLFADWRRGVAESGRTVEPWEDELWLSSEVWPYAAQHALGHASYGCGTFGEKEVRGFPTQRLSGADWVGNIYEPENGFQGAGAELAEPLECPAECRRQPEWTYC